MTHNSQDLTPDRFIDVNTRLFPRQMPGYQPLVDRLTGAAAVEARLASIQAREAAMNTMGIERMGAAGAIGSRAIGNPLAALGAAASVHPAAAMAERISEMQATREAAMKAAGIERMGAIGSRAIGNPLAALGMPKAAAALAKMQREAGASVLPPVRTRLDEDLLAATSPPVDIESISRLAKQVSDSRAAERRAEIERDEKLLAEVQGMRVALRESADREDIERQRAEESEAREERSEAREARLLKLTVVSVIVGILSLAAVVIIAVFA